MKNKKLLSLAMLGLVSVGMFGCSQQPVTENQVVENQTVENEVQTDTTEEVENEVQVDETEESAEGLNAIITKIQEEVTDMPMTMQLKAEEVSMIYGEDFSADMVEDLAVLVPMMQSTTEVGIFKAKDGDTQVIKDVIEQRIANQQGTFEQYLPDQYEIISNAQIFENGDYVYYISAEETNFELMQTIIEDALNQ